MAAAGEFFCRLLGGGGCGGEERDGVLEAEEHDGGGDDSEGALEVGESGGGDEFFNLSEGLLGGPEERDGAKAEGEGEFGAAQGGASEEAGGEEEVEGAAGKNGGGEAEEKAAVGGGHAKGAHACFGKEFVEELGAREFFPEAKGGDEEDGDHEPGEEDGGGVEDPLERLLAEVATKGTDAAVGNEAAEVIGGGSDEAGGFAAFHGGDGAREGPTHADAVHTRDEACDKGSGDGGDAFHEGTRVFKAGGWSDGSFRLSQGGI